MKDNNYITIQGWMINTLKLKGNELMVFALIYGFSQDGQSRFKGSLKYLNDFLGVSTNTTRKTLDILCEKDLIIKHPITVNNVTFNDYSISDRVYQILTGGISNIDRGVYQNLIGGISNIDTHITKDINNIHITKDINKKNKQKSFVFSSDDLLFCIEEFKKFHIKFNGSKKTAKTDFDNWRSRKFQNTTNKIQMESFKAICGVLNKEIDRQHEEIKKMQSAGCWMPNFKSLDNYLDSNDWEKSFLDKKALKNGKSENNKQPEFYKNEF